MIRRHFFQPLPCAGQHRAIESIRGQMNGRCNLRTRNNMKTNLLGFSAAACALALASCSTGIPPHAEMAPSNGSSKSPVATSGSLEQALVQSVNRHRTSMDAPALPVSGSLSGVSRQHSRYMAANEASLPTDTTDVSYAGREGRAFKTRRLFRQGAYAENVAAIRVPASSGGDVDELAERVVGMWLDTPNNRKPLLSKDWTSMGISAEPGTDGNYFVTLSMGTQTLFDLDPSRRIGCP